MTRSIIFKKDRNIYWSAEFSDVVNLLRGISSDGIEDAQHAMFQTNAHVMVLAAAIGAKVGGGIREVSNQKKEISTQVFFSQRLDAYLLLLPMIANPTKGQDFIRPENDDIILKEFEGLAGRGFEVLSNIFNDSPGKSPEILLQTELLKLLPAGADAPALTGSDDIPNIFS
jgi:hypothetical protein